MTPIDWRELYATNRAVIEGRSPVGTTSRSPSDAPVHEAPGGFAEHRSGRTGDPSDRGHARSSPVLPPLPVVSGRRGRRDGAQPVTGADGAGTWRQLTGTGRSQGRPSFVYIPAGVGRDTPAPLVVMLHGCTQTAAGLAAGTLMNQTADRHGFIVAYPQQTIEHNGQSCWNWFLKAHQRRGAGEPQFIAGVAQAVIDSTSSWTIDAGRVFVAGMSAGAAMAAVMGATYPDLFAAIAIHSGLAYGCATSQRAAYAAMEHGPAQPAALGELGLHAMGRFARCVPVIVIHGGADRIVAPVNGEQVVEQWMAINRLAAADAYDADLQHPSATARGRVDGGHPYTCHRWTDRHGRLMQEYVKVDALGHAWSGGAAGGSYTDPRGPSGSEAIWRFFTDATA